MGVFGSNSEKPLSYLRSAPSKFPYSKIWCKKIKILNFGNKNARFPYFWAEISKYYCHIWNQLLRICLVAEFGANIKILKFGSKNAWFGYFWRRNWKLYCHIWNQHSRIYLIAKFCEKMKMPKFGTKSALFGYGAGTWKCVIFEISTFEFV